MISSVRYTGVVLCVGICPCTRAHIIHGAMLVGPVGGAAVARLVDLALLLQATRLATLARTTLNVNKQVDISETGHQQRQQR